MTKVQSPIRKNLILIFQKIKKELNLDANVFVRREYDGVTQLNWLIEKMMGELLSHEEIFG